MSNAPIHNTAINNTASHNTVSQGTPPATRTSILVFDSGVGGLSVLSAIQQHLPGQHWIFCSDNAFFPYGTKPEAALVERVCQVLLALHERYHPDIIVLACNTASTVALAAARQCLPVPVIGVVPAIKPAAALSHSGVIGLLATPGTISRPYTRQLIADFAAHCEVIPVGSSELVWMAEDHLRHRPIDPNRLADILSPLRSAIATCQLDTVVLACTHFPLLIDELKAQLPEVEHWVDSGEAIARRVAWQLQQTPPATPVQQATADQQATAVQQATATQPAASIALFTRLDEQARALADTLRGYQLENLAELPLPATGTDAATDTSPASGKDQRS